METTTQVTEHGTADELGKLLSEHDTALLTTQGADGHFHSRPMALQKQSLSIAEIWFATWDDTEKVHDLEHDAHCCVSLLASERASTYVSLSGRGQIMRDTAKIRELWSPAWKAWFPDGPNSGRIALIRFVPEHAEYVHPKTGRLAVVSSMLKNLMGQRSEPAPKKELELH